MQVKWFQSLSMKLFALMSVCLILTVGAVTWQQSSVLQDFLHRQLEDSTILKSKEVAGTLTSQLQHWRGLGTLAVARMSGSTPEAYGEFIASFTNSDPDLEAFELLDGTTGKSLIYKSRTNGLLTEDKDAKNIEGNLRDFTSNWVRQNSKALATQKIEISDLSTRLKMPLLALAVRFKIAGQDTELWAVMTVQSQTILASIASDSTMKGWILDQDLKPILTSFDASSDGGEPSTYAGRGVDSHLLAAIKTAKSEFGFKSYKDQNGEDLLGAYTQLSDYALTVVVTQEGRGARLAILRTLLHTLLWAWLFVLCAVLVSYLLSQGVTRNLKAATLATQRIASGDFTANLLVKGRDEVAALSHSVNSMAAQIRNLLDSKVAAARQEKELETARLVQETLFPRSSLQDGPLSVTAKTVPASECGGDWWGHFKANDDRHYIFIADATGHGAAAAIVSAIAYSICHSLATLVREASIAEKKPSEILKMLNHTLSETGHGTTTMTFFAGCIDLRAGKMTFANAGHNQPFLIPKSVPDARIGKGKAAADRYHHCKLKANGTPLGLDGTSTYIDETIDLAPGDKIVLYTDGLFECVDKKNRRWGERSLRKALDTHMNLEPSAFQDSLLKEAFTHFDGEPTNDDITLVVVDFAQDWQQNALPRAG